MSNKRELEVVFPLHWNVMYISTPNLERTRPDNNDLPGSPPNYIRCLKLIITLVVLLVRFYTNLHHQIIVIRVISNMGLC